MKGRRRHVRNVLISVALLLIGVAVLRATLADNEHPACQRYADLLDGKELAFSHTKQARADLEAELKDDPDAECALKGLVLLSTRNCEAGERLLHQALLSRAEKVFVAELDADPGVKCARAGLRHVGDKRCRIARDLVRKKLIDQAKEILKSETLPDARAVCPGVPPQRTEQPKQQRRPNPDD